MVPWGALIRIDSIAVSHQRVILVSAQKMAAMDRGASREYRARSNSLLDLVAPLLDLSFLYDPGLEYWRTRPKMHED